MARHKTLQQKVEEHARLKMAGHRKVEELTIHQLRKFLAAYRNPGGWNKESQPQIAAKDGQ
jgi:hypothetical protein